MPTTTFEQAQKVVDQLNIRDQARLLEYLTPRVVGTVVMIKQAEAIEGDSLPLTVPALHQNKQHREMLTQTAVFKARLEELKQTHLGEYVAFHQGELVDHDSEHRQLVQRVKARYPQEVVLIRQVTPQPQPPLRLGSPRFVRSS